MDKLIFMKKWYDAIMNDKIVETTPQEMAYILYAAAKYAFEGEKINFGSEFGPEFKGLGRAMPNIYSQMESIKEYGEKFQGVNQKYNDDEVRELASRGMTQKEICEELGYDSAKSKSLSSNKGYKEGRKMYLENKKLENDSFGKNSDSSLTEVERIAKTSEKKQEIAKTSEEKLDFFNF